MDTYDIYVKDDYQMLLKESAIESILRQFQDEQFENLTCEELNKVLSKIMIEINKISNCITIETETINNIKVNLKNLVFLNDDMISKVLCYNTSSSILINFFFLVFSCPVN
jgi:predicted RNA-binding protein with EMAP domain